MTTMRQNYVDPYAVPGTLRAPAPVPLPTTTVSTVTPGVPSTPASQGTLGQPTNTQSSGSTASTGSNSGSSTSEKSGTSTSARTGTTEQTTANMSPEMLAALQTLIAQLSGGGTPQMLLDRAAKATEVSTIGGNRAGYSKEAAFSDAQGLMAQTMRQSLEKLMPAINAGALGAGASQSSMRALLVQKAAENAAEAASAQGLGAATSYGNISNGMSGTLASILGQSDPAIAALVNAFSVAKGATQQVTGTTTENATGTSTERGTGTTVGTENKSGTGTDNKAIQYGAGLPSTPAMAGTPSTTTTTSGLPMGNGLLGSTTLGGSPPGVTPPLQGPAWTYNGPVDNGMGQRAPSGVAGIPADVLAELARGSNGGYASNFQF